jgi:hypothetical protein
MWARLKRWLYRGNRQSAFVRQINRAVAWLHAAGLGRWLAFPLVMTRHEGERYLVSMLGRDARWVRNVIAAGGHARIRRRGIEEVCLDVVADDRKGPILRAYLADAPGARPHIPLALDAPLSAFASAAPNFPVFRIRSAAD